MRIVAGMYRGRNLKTLSGNDVTRPTADKIKEALFSILGNLVADASVLDLFAGSGALGLEALSRGAKEAFFIDESKDAIKIIKQNILVCRAEEKSKVYLADYSLAIKKLKDKQLFDIVFLDPPYFKGFGVSALSKLESITSENCIVVLETDNTEDIPEKTGDFEIYDKRKYGRTSISFFRKQYICK